MAGRRRLEQARVAFKDRDLAVDLSAVHLLGRIKNYVLQLPPTANYAHTQHGAVASQQALSVLSVEEVLGLPAIAAIQVNVSKTAHIDF
ncbi:hypothetical protein D3C76_1459460 [compost metagenome]